jgi:phosphonate transport system substrate-binding protein
MKYNVRHSMPAVGLVLVLLWPAARLVAETERSFGVVPRYSPSATAQRWQPLLDLVAAEARTRMRFQTASGISVFEERLLDGVYDYAYLNALLFKRASNTRGYRALARNSEPLTGIIVVKKDGPTNLAALRNKTIAFPAPRAFGATILPRTDLKQMNIPHHVVYLGSHESAYQAVLKDRFMAAGGVMTTFLQLPESVRDRLRVLHTTRPVTSHVFAAHPRVPKDEADRVQRALFGIHKRNHGAKLLESMRLTRLVPVTAADLALLDGFNLPRRINRLNFHVIPRHKQNATRTHMLPLAANLKQRLELDVQLKTYTNMEDFEKGIYEEKSPALINANPLQAIRLIPRGFDIVAQQLPANYTEGMRGMLLVRQDSPYHKLTDLKGKAIAFGGNENAFFATIVPKVLLARAGLAGQYIDKSRPGPISDLLPRLKNGEVEAIGLGSLMLNNEKMREQYIEGRMRVLVQSEPMLGLPWLVGPRLDPDTRDEIKHLLLTFSSQSAGHAAFKVNIQNLQPADNNTYKQVRRYLDEAGIR